MAAGGNFLVQLTGEGTAGAGEQQTEKKGYSTPAFSHNLRQVTGSPFATAPTWQMSTVVPPMPLLLFLLKDQVF